ncbi:cinnamyl alcohol dehydrogenase 7 [Artemisia annua]|uniref:Cinnamyl alcohol dehydrogenase 7 n=1 Tax=Artemisia annua TaxID=35608 RepID=A0A2U1KY23_ARTAN|nr:cinnamyl alcohol dehydrogenase 7 [Artemisia annua]
MGLFKSADKLSLEQAVPLLCAGVTTYSRLKQFVNSEKPIKAGILGLGGVGHLGVIISKTTDHHVTLISCSNKKREKAFTTLWLFNLDPTFNCIKGLTKCRYFLRAHST